LLGPHKTGFSSKTSFGAELYILITRGENRCL
jgi:hypothetical protein